MTAFDELARLGVATVHEAMGRGGLVDVELVQVVAGSRTAGPARTALCGPADNLMAHAAVAHAEPGDVLVLTMTEPAPVALVGDLLVTQAIRRGVAALLVDGAVRDVEELQTLGLPVWARRVRARAPRRTTSGSWTSRSSSAAPRSTPVTPSSSSRRRRCRPCRPRREGDRARTGARAERGRGAGAVSRRRAVVRHLRPPGPGRRGGAS